MVGWLDCDAEALKLWYDNIIGGCHTVFFLLVHTFTTLSSGDLGWSGESGWWVGKEGGQADIFTGRSG